MAFPSTPTRRPVPHRFDRKAQCHLGREQVALGVLRVVEEFALHPELLQTIPDESDHLEVGVPADSGKADQSAE